MVGWVDLPEGMNTSPEGEGKGCQTCTEWMGGLHHSRGPALTSDFALPEGERYHHVKRFEATSVNAAAGWLKAV